MQTTPERSDAEVCPFLVPVVSDRLWMVSTGLYCRRPEGRVHVPARRTLADVCLTPSYRACGGYRLRSGEVIGEP